MISSMSSALIKLLSVASDAFAPAAESYPDLISGDYSGHLSSLRELLSQKNGFLRSNLLFAFFRQLPSMNLGGSRIGTTSLFGEMNTTPSRVG